MSRAYYVASGKDFLQDSKTKIVGCLNSILDFDREIEQQVAWNEEIDMLKEVVSRNASWGNGYVVFEYSIPRLCGRIDAVILLGETIFALEYKVGEKSYEEAAKKQLLEYCLDLKYFHEASRSLQIVPILVCTKAKRRVEAKRDTWGKIRGIECCRNSEDIAEVISKWHKSEGVQIQADSWLQSKYSPTPTIIEAAIALYEHHDVKDITKTSDDPHATNLTKTTSAIKEIIAKSKQFHRKGVCFVTGVPGAGKTLVGLNLATAREYNRENDDRAVFLSGNAPLVAVLQHALQQDAKTKKRLIKKLLKEKGCTQIPDEVVQYFTFALKKTFVQDIYGFRKNYLEGGKSGCRMAIFDEAQRCWTKQKMVRKLQRKIDRPIGSEPECLIDQMDKNDGWSVIVCLIGNGQEIHDGEAGIVEWLRALNEKFTNWDVYLSDFISNSPESFDVKRQGVENTVKYQIDKLASSKRLQTIPSLHLGVSLRSFRSEQVSDFATAIVENHPVRAHELLAKVAKDYPIAMTRNLDVAKQWVRDRSKRTDDFYLERFGAVASSGASRIRPEGIVVPGIDMNVPKWMLGSEKDVDSSYFLELAASEFKIQGLEVDYSLVIWEGDYRHDGNEFKCFKFGGCKWQNVKNETLQNYLKNAYRVLLTRSRQGFIIYVPTGNPEDLTKLPSNYDGTYRYLQSIGIKEI